MPLSPVPDIIAELKAGRMVILVDEEDRENEGDLVIAAEHITPQAINFMATHARGLICLTLTAQRCAQLGLRHMVERNGASHGTAFTASIEAAEGVTTGISAADRARTVQAAVARNAKPSDLVQPGHVFPLMAAEGGVLMRAGHTEAGCDLAALAGLEPAAVICEVMNADGTMARLPDLERFAAQHDLKIGAIADLIEYRSRTESLVQRVGEQAMQTPFGPMRCVAYTDRAGHGLHLALVHGALAGQSAPLVRVHEPLSVLDLLDSECQRHSWNLPQALQRIVQEGSGVAVLLNCGESAQQLQIQFERLREPAPTPPKSGVSALRDYGIGAQILRDLGVRQMRLLGPARKMPSMAGYGLEIQGFESAPQTRCTATPSA
ncbi:MAG: bifunctional 3,4-dihydroxy-2-butanone-4-phosphate synthase/GTP cyclohydrolase II [Thiomonas sp.]|uniref:bifunctional 3,4-dihydroxy-2-butanone-4-phosphate synthase/GTP cyclohydrolase II n=1 Tax=Thiomonas sp. TaxID=2047785 RepID=UPI002A358BD2|nr:bifunctional 3,4-dihydroxy-2-butanone-4-phosphate synthase/GTP cyclohydrolase II [Thiomonas sp.]MDY0329598.1 bifunctional 3,4-dihydroxy-2-butanone-4-phosphate synthase/GTP cyclohydrolase II [Thiomonas sp.]